MTEEKLIEEVREFPCIWNTCSRSYKDQRARENANPGGQYMEHSVVRK